MSKTISGFSKLSKSKKIDWIVETYFSHSKDAERVLKQYWNTDEKLQQLHDEFIENTISNYYLPLGVAPNFQINGKLYTIPMAIEESSVVAAASKAAKFWLDRGGFKATVLSTTKIGQVHFLYDGAPENLKHFFKTVKPKLISASSHITKNMESRGGGVIDIELRDKTNSLKNYYQLHVSFETLDAMGANFINSCLEQFAKTFKEEALVFDGFFKKEKNIQIVMSILSNYVPDCLVRAEVSCKVADLAEGNSISGEAFANKFLQAIAIAEVEPHRAVTHNKGIMNGVDAVVLATGNDFRAIEAGVHAYASKNGSYSSLSHAKVENDIFTFWMEIPLALGTVGGLTGLHPLVKLALELLHKPSAKELMQIVAVAGLAQNFAAIRSLITTGIQQGHMKMHLLNILNQFEANEAEKAILTEHFKTQTVSYSAVSDALANLRVKIDD
ncbi:hydroxymethylglutaryl-CoA reductase, degradative [Flavobacteriaceae bacterium XHP0103]|uniref:hydroxymethylglutaryl-CoA reductase, degradative n=1 Tax=Marixanthotalea marina TaxID=2844359 RepID=UPI002989BBA8|nr:hydroxymethylglutaryl-CoA reductase, degradative [Marixanthotalea marina]MBU3821049.1 hydroxymethylglutaryl-CoA reductase, degradative [Marixanthotalea marina]